MILGGCFGFEALIALHAGADFVPVIEASGEAVKACTAELWAYERVNVAQR